MPNTVKKEVKQEIMATDVYVAVTDAKIGETEIRMDVEECFQRFRHFEERFSRFIEGNELTSFNASPAGKYSVSADFFRMLTLSKKFHAVTEGVFDITLLSSLEKEGYTASALAGFTSEKKVAPKPQAGLDAFSLEEDGFFVTKPENARVDLGGIGKGYIVDQIAQFLLEKYEHFIVDAGGDLYVHGRDIERDYNAWVIGVENPLTKQGTVASLIVSGQGVATSGVNRRKWKKDGEQKHHLIHHATGKSAVTDLVAVTVVAETVTEADCLAKSILIMGSEKGLAFAESHRIAALLIDQRGVTHASQAIADLLWKPEMSI